MARAAQNAITEPPIVSYCMELQPVQPSSKYLINKAWGG